MDLDIGFACLRRRIIAVVWSTGLLLCSGTAPAQESATIPQTLRSIIGGDEDIASLIEDQLRASTMPGISLPSRPFKVGLSELFDRALSSHLRYRQELLNESIAAASVQLADAVFDTTMGLRVAHTETRYMDRSEMITRERETEDTIHCDEVTGECDPSGENISEEQADVNDINLEDSATQDAIDRLEQLGRLSCVIVNGEVLNPDYCTVQTEISTRREYASVKTDTVPQANSFVLEALKIFSWGGDINATLQSTRRIKTYYTSPNRLERFDGPLNDPVDRGTNFPWTSSFALTFNTPLPMTRDFGDDVFGPAVGSRAAELDYEITRFGLEQSANDILVEVQEAFSSLVKNQAALAISAHQMNTLADISRRSRRLYEQRRITSYDLAQIDTEYEQAQISKELAWHDYLRSSNALAFLLNLDRDVYLIADFSAEYPFPAILDATPDYQAILPEHPQLAAAQRALQKAEALLRNGEAQLRPDLRFVFSVEYGQSDQVFGYESWNESLQNVFDPDQRIFYIGLSYSIAFGRRAEKSAWSQARLRKQRAENEYALARNRVMGEINTLGAGLVNQQKALQQRRQAYQLASLAMEKANRLREQGVITEFERLRTMQEMYGASLAFFSSSMDYRTEEARNLAARGGLYRLHTERKSR